MKIKAEWVFYLLLMMSTAPHEKFKKKKTTFLGCVDTLSNTLQEPAYLLHAMQLLYTLRYALEEPTKLLHYAY